MALSRSFAVYSDDGLIRQRSYGIPADQLLVLLIPLPFLDAFAPNVPGKNFAELHVVQCCRRLFRLLLKQPASSSRDDEKEDKDVDDNGKDVFSHRSNHRTSFRNHLRVMTQSTRSKVTLANRMDDELKRMEIRFLCSRERPRCRYEEVIPIKDQLSNPMYRAAPWWPNATCWINRVGAELSRSCHRQMSNTFGRAAPNNSRYCLSQCLDQRGRMEKADEWLTDMEESLLRPATKFDAPDTVVYLLLGRPGEFANSKIPCATGRAVFQRCWRWLRQIDTLRETTAYLYCSNEVFDARGEWNRDTQ
jgi:hypothetical protein